MNSDKLLEDLESLVMNASKVPFTNKNGRRRRNPSDHRRFERIHAG